MIWMVSIVMGVPQNAWFIMENPNLKWMIRGYPHLWKPPNGCKNQNPDTRMNQEQVSFQVPDSIPPILHCDIDALRFTVW